jgi:hypothetical protein
MTPTVRGGAKVPIPNAQNNDNGNNELLESGRAAQRCRHCSFHHPLGTRSPLPESCGSRENVERQ